ncbi:hypothetical protein [Rhizobium sp. PP-CC-3G-465]|uniref:hypothetical protein n=1 Tax=Rhizobium sp. PP-CC-3G-465 TaxID=2135648 RepID=UPI00104EC8FD|nr:hypothetical protein C8J33_11613 [Rhizobium sp. PP-CC-3G-465]
MSALPTREYRVFLDIWDVYEVTVQSTSEQQALPKAEALYDAEGLEAFSHVYTGTDGFRSGEAE